MLRMSVSSSHVESPAVSASTVGHSCSRSRCTMTAAGRQRRSRPSDRKTQPTRSPGRRLLGGSSAGTPATPSWFKRSPSRISAYKPRSLRRLRSRERGGGGQRERAGPVVSRPQSVQERTDSGLRSRAGGHESLDGAIAVCVRLGCGAFPSTRIFRELLTLKWRRAVSRPQCGMVRGGLG